MATLAPSSAHSTPPTVERGLRASLWISQIVLAVVFAIAGGMKASMPMYKLARSMGSVAMLPEALVRFIGLCELAAAVALIVPSAFRIVPRLTPMAAFGLASIMALAMGFHLMRSEIFMLPVNVLLGGLALFVTWGRAFRAPITPR